MRVGQGAPESAYAPLARDELEERLARAKAKLDEVLPLPERFEIDPPSAETEARIRPFLDRVIVRDGASPGYAVECRGRVCKVDVTTSKQTVEEWMHALQTDEPTRGMFGAMTFGEQGTYLKLEPPARAAANMWAFAFVRQVHADPRVAACKQAHPAPGEVLLVLHFDATAARVVVSPALGNTATGPCIQQVVEDLLVRATLPADIAGLPDLPIRVQVP